MTQLDWMLKDLIDTVAGARLAVVATADGLLRGHVGDVTEDDAESLAALCTSLRSLSANATQRFIGGTETRTTWIESDEGFLFVRGGGPGALLGLVTDANTDAGRVYAEMELLVVRLGEFLTSPPRAEDGVGT